MKGPVAVFALAVLLAVAMRAQAPQLPTEISSIRHNSGESVTPYFEGWIRNANGTFDLVFGYFNRNFAQEFSIAAGPDNFVEAPSQSSGRSVDQGQPTYFMPRRQRYVYRVHVPSDFGQKEVVWSVTANGRTERAYGSLIPAEEITDRVVTTNGNYDPAVNDPNKPPSITIAPLGPAVVGNPVTLTAIVTDDGLPKPRRPATRVDPKAVTAGFGGQVNGSGTQPQGLTVRWLHYSGPGKVIFGQTGTLQVANGQAMTTATFAEPGTYKLIAVAEDAGHLSTRIDVIVLVQ